MDNNVDHSHHQHNLNISLDDNVGTSRQQSFETTTGGGGGGAPMIRGVPNRRTFDSGYGGDSQSCVSSPIAEPKKRFDLSGSRTGESFTSQMSHDSYTNSTRTRSRARLSRQKAIDRGSCPSSAQSSHRSSTRVNGTNHGSRYCRSAGSRNGAIHRRMANSSTDYEDDNDESDEMEDFRSMHSLSLGRLPRGDSGCYQLKAYGRLRRKTSFNSSSSDGELDDADYESNVSSRNDSIGGPTNTASSSESIDHQFNEHRGLDHLKPPHLTTTQTNNVDLSPQIVSS